MTDWNFADAFEVVAAKVPDAPCQKQGDRTVTWAEFDRRANGFAAELIEAGLTKQSKVAAYLTNCPEYLEIYQAAFKAGLVPVNTNFRYGPEEILYLFDNADAEAVVFHATYTDLLEKVRDRLPKVRRWYVVEDGSPLPEWAVPYEDVASAGTAEAVRAPWGRSGDDLLILYTGGTTGMPKGVMWRQDDLFNVLGGGGNPIVGVPPAADLDEFASRIVGPGMTMLPACPLMHGTGQFSSFIAMNGAGCIVSLESRKFEAEDLWRTVEQLKVNAVVIVGDAFAKPMLAELEAKPGAYDLSSLLLISSSGVMWSQDTKEGLMKQIPQVVLFDSLGSSEAVGLASNTSAAGAAPDTAKFELGETVKVFTDDNRAVEPGSTDIGFVAITGFIPVGYYKDEEKTAKTFRTIDGVRYSIPGDYASVNPDGSLHLLGRGSVVINTGGEKVYPEEVEEVLKEQPSVRDAVCVGVPDERFGETICAIVEPQPGADIDEDGLIEAVRARLARYKAPRRVLVVDTIGRSPAGKVDYKALQALARERVAPQ
ncbi:MAG: 3-oxocholest-4-en-26-oate---CoA ligase [Acidimicrobiaceae bacterium]|nr:3-oxocholest-4-en-26-oate---CoA ligase [Acidimicrobiaceae bacterium]